MLQVKDAHRILEFEGEEIGFSTSHRAGALRWIEFRLYKTKTNKQYILSRTGYSKFYHLPDCEIAERSKLDESPREEIERSDAPCQECRPDLDKFAPFVCFECEIYWAKVYSNPTDLINGLMRRDSKTGNRYMTSVARRLLEDAQQTDDALLYTKPTEYVL